MTRRDAEQAAAWVRERPRRSRHFHIAERNAPARINSEYRRLTQEKAVRILKFQLQITDEQTLQLPAGALILSAQAQRDALGRDALCMWAACPQTDVTAPRTFDIFGTGHYLPPRLGNFLATVQIGPMVWHVFERVPAVVDSSNGATSSPAAG